MSTILTHPEQFHLSKTHGCLTSACLGEIQARRQYLLAAQRCEACGLHVVAHAFRFTAAQEKEHADIFGGLLMTFGGEHPAAAADAAVPLPDAPLDILHAVAQTEGEEADKLYPAYARIADGEGYARIATALRRIAETEQLHARRFRQYEDALRGGTLFASSHRVGWLCLPCGHLHYGCSAPETCDTCGRGQGHFIRSSFEPFTILP